MYGIFTLPQISPYFYVFFYESFNFIKVQNKVRLVKHCEKKSNRADASRRQEIDQMFVSVL